jgi:hypothetical protein
VKSEEDGQELSAVSDHLTFVAPFLDDSLLISAYDVAHGLLPDLDLLVTGGQSVYSTPTVLMLDSGGYEMSADFDVEQVHDWPHNPKDFTQEQLSELIASLNNPKPVIAVNRDHSGPYDEQVQQAQEFFAGHAGVFPNFLLKPEPGASYYSPDRIAAVVREFTPFKMIGLTEKELGNSFLDRMVCLASIRRHMDVADMRQPIHVFGSLDPLLSPLYFLAGAEVFDGLSWLRYAYVDGRSVYREAPALLQATLHHRLEQRMANMLVNNIKVLGQVQSQMREFLVDREWDAFRHNAEHLEESYRAFRSALPWEED